MSFHVICHPYLFESFAHLKNQVVYFLCTEFGECFLYSGNKSFIRYMICRSFFLICGLSFQSLTSVFWSSTCFKFNEAAIPTSLLVTIFMPSASARSVISIDAKDPCTGTGSSQGVNPMGQSLYINMLLYAALCSAPLDLVPPGSISGPTFLLTAGPTDRSYSSLICSLSPPLADLVLGQLGHA